MSSYKIKSLPLLKHYGQHALKEPFIAGFEKRLIANDYNNKFELFYDEVIIFEKISNLLLRDVVFFKYQIAAREKLTQLLIAGHILTSHLSSAEKQIKDITNNNFNLSSSYFSLLNEVEFFLYKLSSLLDILAKLSSHFYKVKEGKKVASKYGQQKAFNAQNNTFYKSFDLTYQNRLLKNTVINSLHSYRNEFTHNSSLKLIPWKRKWSITLVITKGNKEGIKTRLAIEKAFGELKRFIQFYESYFLKYLKNNP